MAVTASDIDRVPDRNLRVSRMRFGEVWLAADGRSRALTPADTADWYLAGVVVVCMWLAGATVTPTWGRPYPARSPATDRELHAYPESIEAELVAAELLMQRRPWLTEQWPGWYEGILATLRWAWRAEGPPPLVTAEVPAAQSAP